MANKIVYTVEEALSGLTDGMSLAVGGFGTNGNAFELLNGIVDMGVKDLVVYSNNPGSLTADGLVGLGRLFDAKQVSKFVGSFIGFNSVFENQYMKGEVEVHFTPQGTLAEKMRAGGAGIPAFYTPTGAGSLVSEGGLPVRHGADLEIVEVSQPKETRTFLHNGEPREFVLEESIRADYAIVRAWKADAEGNLVFRRTAQNFNPDAAMCGRITVVEAEEIVPVGGLQPEEIHLPGIFVDRVLPLTREQVQAKPVEVITIREPGQEHFVPAGREDDRPEVGWSRNDLARRAALELSDGQYVNLGIGLPTKVPDFIPDDVDVTLQSENGLLKTGPFPLYYEFDPDTINAGKETVTVRPGGSVFGSSMSFAMIRGGHINTAILGAFEVNEFGDIANWGIPGKKVRGMGGAMDLVEGAETVIALMEHSAPDGSSRVRTECSFPLTARRAVDKLITNFAVFDISEDGLTVVELAPGVTLEFLREHTEPDFAVALNG